MRMLICSPVLNNCMRAKSQTKEMRTNDAREAMMTRNYCCSRIAVTLPRPHFPPFAPLVRQPSRARNIFCAHLAPRPISGSGVIER